MLILSGSFCAVGEGWAVCGVYGEGDECVRPWGSVGVGKMGLVPASVLSSCVPC